MLDVSWRDDSNVLASASADGTVKLWEMNNGKAIKSFNAHGGGVNSVHFDHQGRIATAGNDNRARLWDANGKRLNDLPNGSEDMLEVAVSHDGKRLIYGNWSGEVFNTPLEQPKEMTPLAANPEPAEKRIEAIKASLVSVQQKLAPAKANLDKALQGVATAKKPIADLDARVATLRKQGTDSEAAAKAAEQASAEFDKQLPSISTSIRDLQDEVTALRVALKSDASKMVAVAEAEEKLAAQLTGIAKQRRDRVARDGAIKTHRQTAAAKKAEADKLAATRPELEKKLQQAQTLADAAKQAHDEIAQVVSKVQSKVDRLLAEIK